MGIHDAEFIRQLQAAFHAEAQEHLQAISSCLLQMEKAGSPEDARKFLEEVFRETHSLKGAARTVSFAEIERTCQELESVFAAWKQQGYVPQPADFDVVLRAVDCVTTLAAQARQGLPADPQAVEPVVQALRPLHEPQHPAREAPRATPHAESAAGDAARMEPPDSRPAAAAELPPVRAATPETVRISTAKLDALLRQAEELLPWKLAANQRVVALRQLQDALQTWERQWARLLPDWRSLQQAVEKPGLAQTPVQTAALTARLLEFVEWSHTWNKSWEGRLAAVSHLAEQEAHSLGGMVDHLLDDAKRLLMLPFATLLAMLPKLVRDLARDQGKQVELVIRGGEVEIDKRILEELKDPLIHLVRNSIDHGLEKPAVRTAQGKPPQGSLTLTISQVNGNKVQLLLQDDGGGIDVRRVRDAAVRQGLLSAERAGQLDEQESLALIFQSGVSTSPMLTEVSGRGLGMAIVREKVERLEAGFPSRRSPATARPSACSCR